MLTKQEMKSCGNFVCLSVKNLSEKYRDFKIQRATHYRPSLADVASKKLFLTPQILLISSFRK